MSILQGKAVILNAPPGAGKDTVAKSISIATGAAHSEFKHHLYVCTATLFNVDLESLKEAATDREIKERPYPFCPLELKISYQKYKELCEQTGGEPRSRELYMDSTVRLTPREALIYTSEVVVKPNFGEDYFGKAAASMVNKVKGTVFSDGGFDKEVEAMVEELGIENVFIVKFTREGYMDFKGDSRDWLNVPEGVRCLATSNNGRVSQIRDEIIDWVREVS